MTQQFSACVLQIDKDLVRGGASFKVAEEELLACSTATPSTSEHKASSSQHGHEVPRKTRDA